MIAFFFRLSFSSDLSVLPKNGSNLSLSAPTQGTPIFVAVGLTLSVLFWVAFVLISFRHKMNAKLLAILEKPMVQRISAWMGFLGFFVGKKIIKFSL